MRPYQVIMSQLAIPTYTCIAGHVQRHGTVLIFVLIVLSSMTALAIGSIYRIQTDLKVASHFANNTQAYHLALGGIERALALLSQEELTEQRIAAVAQFAGNAEQEQLFEQILTESFPKSPILNYRICDEQAFFNLNGRFADRFEYLVGRETASQVLDWIDEDNESSGFSGAESDDYLSLPEPYSAGNAPFYSLKELLYLKSVSSDQYTGEDVNRNNLLDENENDGDLSLPLDNADNILNSGLLDLFTTVGNDLLNINTVSVDILNAIGGLDEPPVSDLIIAHRHGPDGVMGTDDDKCFTQPEDIMIEGLTPTQLSILKDTSKFCFTSEFFRIYAYAKTTKSGPCCLMVTVHFSENKPKVISMEKLL